MAKDPAFMFYSSDFLVGTMTMSFEDRGKYITLLSYMHQNGRVNNETIRLLVGSVSDMLRLKFSQDTDGNWYNNRLEIEIEKRKNFIESRQENGKKGGRPPKNKEKLSKKTYAKPTHNLGDNDNIDDNIDDNISNKYKGMSFEIFWNEYDKKVGLKEKVEKKWQDLTHQERLDAIDYIPLYKISQPDKKYRKDPSTFLNNKSWLDEIITNTQPASKFQSLVTVNQLIKNPYESANNQNISID